MADEDELLVQVEGEDHTDNEGRDGLEPAVELKRQFDELQAQNKRDREAKEASDRRAALAEQAADRARKDADAARTAVADSQADSIVAGLSAAQAEAAAAEADYAALMEKGDFTGAAKAQRRIAAAEAKIVRLDEAKADLEARKSSGVRQDDPPPRAADPFEDHVSKFTPRTADWMRAHRDWVVDPRKSAKLTGAHHMAVGDGLTPDTDEYFEHVEKTLGLRDAPEKKNGADNQQQNRSVRRSTPVVAPVNGAAGAHSSGAENNRGQTVSLTKGEAERATDGSIVWNKGSRDRKGNLIDEKHPLFGKPIGVQEYARRKVELDKGGFYDKMYTHG